MATIIHTNLLQGMLGAGALAGDPIDFNTDNIDASLLDETDSGVITATFDDYDEVNTNVVATADVTVTGITGGVVSASAVTFTSVSGAGGAADYLTVWKNTGTPATSPLAITWDSITVGLPVTPNGGDITATWGSNTLLQLS